MSNHHAAKLGRLAKGKPKKFSPEEIKKRTARIVAARRKHLAQARKRKAKKR